MGETVILATEVPELAASVAPDISPILEKLDTLININMSMYAWIALFITLLVGGFVIYIMLKPLIYFLH